MVEPNLYILYVNRSNNKVYPLQVNESDPAYCAIFERKDERRIVLDGGHKYTEEEVQVRYTEYCSLGILWKLYPTGKIQPIIVDPKLTYSKKFFYAEHRLARSAHELKEKEEREKNEAQKQKNSENLRRLAVALNN